MIFNSTEKIQHFIFKHSDGALRLYLKGTYLLDSGFKGVHSLLNVFFIKKKKIVVQ